VGLPLLVLATFLSYPLGLAVGQPWLLPILNTAPAYLAMAQRLRRGDRHGAVVAVLVWALALAVFGTTALALWPVPADALVVNGPEYRDEMFRWIRTGAGSEGSLSAFLPQHLLHVAAFVALSLATASTLSILMGAVLMNYMDFYVASLWRAGVPFSTVLLLGWQPYAICRVAAFCTLGAVLAEPLLSRLRPYGYTGLGSARRYLLWAAAGILADWIIKAAVAPSWGLGLREALPPLR
jgi:hypothetical protein